MNFSPCRGRCARALVFGYLFILAAIAAPSEPLSLHPENSHYFLFRGKPTVFISSGEHYGAVLNQDFDYLTYLNTLQTKP